MAGVTTSETRLRRLTLPIRVLTILIVVLLVGIALLITGRTEHILIERFNEYHLTMVRLAAREIEHSFGNAARLIDVLLILHADHESNASTFAALVVKSTLADMYSAVVAGIAALKGPLHGGANEQVMKMLESIGRPERVAAWLDEAMAQKKKIMGFGHRVYKTMDPRATILRGYAREVTRRAGTEHWLVMAEQIEKTMVEKFGQKGIWPNVDFFSGVVMASLGIDPSMFTPLFAVGRSAGWVAHAWEQRQDNRLFRPRFVYVGPESEPYVPLAERK